MKRLIFALAFLALAATVHAQAPTVQPPVTGVQFVISGGVSPVTNTLPITSFTSVACSASTVTTNPSIIDYKVNTADPTCWRFTDTGAGPLLVLPIGNTSYTLTLAYVNANGAGPQSPASNPFSRPGVLPTTAPAVVLVHQ